jgi:SAM-dependent methyltransferase
MDPHICAALADLNRTFYAGFADDFAATRQGWPLSYERILPHLRDAANVLDLGCGNGRLLAFLVERGWRGQYRGLDSSPKLLAIARRNARQSLSAGEPVCPGQDAGERSAGQPMTPAAAPAQAEFVWADLLSSEWVGAVAGFAPDVIAGLAVLHHIPAAANRIRFVADCAALLRSGGRLIVSTWQFMAAARLRTRILPWAVAGLRDEDVEPDDYLISWGEQAAGRRYCAAIDADALRRLAESAGLEQIDTFYADGREGNLNLYGIYRKPQ